MTAKENFQQLNAERKTYGAPEITGEYELETRAGSPLGFPDGVDALDPE